MNTKDKMKLVFATSNVDKLLEVSAMLGNRFKIVNLKEIGFEKDIPEPYETLEENSKTKAETIYKTFGFNCFSEDTGLEIDTLNGEPGVYSARYAGEHKSTIDNIEKVLQKLKNEDNRAAQFRTVVTLVLDGTFYQFEGIARGIITRERCGTEGFGYDAIFKPEGQDLRFAQMTKEAKNKISHRGKAFDKLFKFLADLS